MSRFSWPGLTHVLPRISSVIAMLMATAVMMGCRLFGPHLPRDCSLGDSQAQSSLPRTPVDLSALKLYRNTFAVERVGTYEHHFTVWFHDIEPNFVQLRARTDQATGHVHIEVDRGMWGGIGAPPEEHSAPPPSVAELARAVEREARGRCPDSRGWVFQYDGAYREIDLVEFMPATFGGGTTRFGWNGRITLAADEGLSRLIAPAPDYKSGLGVIEANEPLQWMDFTPPVELTGTTLMIDRLLRSTGSAPPSSAEGMLGNAALDAARRFQARAASPSLAEIVAAQGVSLLPPGMEQRLHLHISFYARPKAMSRVSQQDVQLAIPFKTNEAVFGVVRGEADGTVGGVQLKAHAVLTPREPLSKEVSAGKKNFEATLQFDVEDSDGHTFARSYLARSDVLAEGATVAVPYGIGLTDPSDAPETQLRRHGQLHGKGEFQVIDFYVEGITSDPREN